QPDRIDVLELIAAAHQAQGLSRDALSQYREVLEHYVKADDKVAVRRVLESMVKIDPENVSLRVKYAEHLARTQNLDAALKQFSFACKQLHSKERFDDYVKVAERYLHYKPGDDAFLKELIRVFLSDGKARQALAKLQGLYTNQPQDPETLELLAQTFVDLKQDDKAVSVLKELARVYERTQPDSEDALLTWRRAAALDPEDPEINLALQIANDPLAVDMPMLGESVVTAMEPLDDDIIAEALPPPLSKRRRGVDVDEEIDRALADCDVCLSYNLLDKALIQLEKIFELAPNHSEAKERYARVLRMQGRFPEAASEYRNLASMSWEKDKDGSLAFAREAAALDPENPANFNLLLSFGLDPVAYGFSPPAARPAPATAAGRRPPPLPPPRINAPSSPSLGQRGEEIMLQKWDLAPQGNSLPQPIQREAYLTLPPSAFELIDDDEDRTPESSPPALAESENLDFELDNLSGVIPDPDSGELDKPSSPEEDFEALFDLEENDLDQLFGDDLLQAPAQAAAPEEDELFVDPDEPPEVDGQAIMNTINDELAEADFYIAQGLYEDAGSIIDSLVHRFGDHPLVLAARERLLYRLSHY
ncbi:MAG: hypothetical protein RBU37_02805, partial [Myxococcota bacterium]|nr:hypothetical protein [Myxococcota bacterium]